MASGAQKTPESVMTMQGDALPHPTDPSVMKGVIPYLYLGGNTAKAIAFYKTAFRARDMGQMPWKDETTGAEGIMHAQVEINGGALMLSDFHPHLKSFTPPPGVTMQLVVKDGNAWFKRAADAGCTVVAPFEKAFWGDYYGVLTDPFGIQWAVLTPGMVPEKK